MKNAVSLPLIVALALLGAGAVAPVAAAEAAPRRTWTVEGTAREALVHVPAAAKTQPTPVVFAFHGHGGTMQQAARSFRYHQVWPEAIVVYMQGLNTPGQLTDPEGKRPGWQPAPGDQGDRDLKFFDTVLASLRADYRVDDRRIYSTGHSNGGGFTYLLWAMRGEVFAAMAPSGALVSRRAPPLKPKPALHVAGEKDELVKFAWQQQMIASVKGINQCGAGEPWEKIATRYASPIGAPLVTYIHPGGHGFPAAAPALIVTFFKQHAKP
ncbi:MAG: hypothetical protein Q8N18_04710 [Opitutaceae bacterium]|nr:hypothetical protein [Opitutaceae bacterium]